MSPALALVRVAQVLRRLADAAELEARLLAPRPRPVLLSHREPPEAAEPDWIGRHEIDPAYAPGNPWEALQELHTESPPVPPWAPGKDHSR